MKKFALVVFICLALYSCKDGPCITKSGNKITDRRLLSNPTSIYLYDNLNLEIYIDSANFIDVIAGSNLLDKIITETSGENIILRNDNKCAQFRGFDAELKVQLHVKDLNSIYYYGFGNISMKNTLIQTDSSNMDFLFKSENGAGNVNLRVNKNVNIDCEACYSKITLENNVRANSLQIYNSGTSWIHADKFSATSVFVNNNSTGDCIVSVGNHLTYSIIDLGNIKYYSGPNPEITVLNHSGKGRLILLE